MTRMKELEAENTRLKKMYADVQFQNDVIKVHSAGNVLKPVSPYNWRELGSQVSTSVQLDIPEDQNHSTLRHANKGTNTSPLSSPYIFQAFSHQTVGEGHLRNNGKVEL